MKNKNFRPFSEVKEIATKKLPFLSKKLPLAIGVDKEIFSKLKEENLNNKEIKYFIERHFNSAKYVKNCLTMDARYNMNGEPVSEINHSQKMFMRIEANKILEEMKKRGGDSLPIFSELEAAVEPYNEIKKKRKEPKTERKN